MSALTTCSRIIRLTSVCVFMSVQAVAQVSPTQNTNASTFPGENYLITQWPTLRPPYRTQRIVWYKTVKTQSTSQPLILEPISCTDRNAIPAVDSSEFADCDKHTEQNAQFYRPSVPSRDRNPLRDNQKLVIAIYDQAGAFDPSYMFLLNLNVVPQVAAALNPAALRPSISTGGGPGGGQGQGQGAQGFVPGTVYSIAVKAGTPQATAINAPFAPLSVSVTDPTGSPATGIPVTFTAPSTGASGVFSDTNTNTTTVNTESTGVATGNFIANGNPGSYNVTATVRSTDANGQPYEQTATFSLTNVAPRYYYLTWMQRLTGDTTLTVSVTALLPPLPATGPSPSSGAPAPIAPTERPVTLLNATYAQVHAPSTYNVSAGVITAHSGIRPLPAKRAPPL
jgi:hypothetical protein